MPSFRRLQLVSAAFMATSHGLNDAQKTMGIVTLALLIFGKIDTVEILPCGSSFRARNHGPWHCRRWVGRSSKPWGTASSNLSRCTALQPKAPLPWLLPGPRSWVRRSVHHAHHFGLHFWRWVPPSGFQPCAGIVAAQHDDRVGAYLARSGGYWLCVLLAAARYLEPDPGQRGLTALLDLNAFALSVICRQGFRALWWAMLAGARGRQGQPWLRLWDCRRKKALPSGGALWAWLANVKPRRAR